ncbi:sensor histidine kinase [Nocardioides panacis]|nr:HAMP domain-containing sensor histidine kinase [Nocardioides panacis]
MKASRVLPTSLTARLVVTAVALVAVVSVLTAALTFLAMRTYLTGQLDTRVQQSTGRAVNEWEHRLLGGGLPPPRSDADGDGGDGDGPETRFGAGQETGTLSAVYGSIGSGGGVLSKDLVGRNLSASAMSRLRDVPVDGQVHAVTLPHFGSYRVQAVKSRAGTVVAGLPTHEIEATVASLVGYESLLLLVGVSIAAGVGTVLVRRQLRPLRSVAETAHTVSTLPLSSGEIGTTVRVPDALTDERTEVGRVGAALNTMLAHVEHALDERHRSEQQVRQFVADASHELRTPLTTIHGYAELSRRTSPPDPEQLTRAMGKVEAEATRMSSLVEDLLLLARLDAGRPLARDTVDLTRLALEAVGDARVVGRDHRWRLDLPDEPVVAPGDEQRLHQVLTNLLNNARRHTPPGTSVTVGVAEDPDAHEVVLSVEDDGPGLPPQLDGTAFERFTRGDSARTRESGGAGLGLSLVQAISHAHGGRVSVDSAPGHTRFEVRLPAASGALAHR